MPSSASLVSPVNNNFILIISGPLQQCENGHMICNSCRPKLKTCPICSAALNNLRCLIAEKLLEELPQKCCYSKHGCTVELIKEERLRHEKICKHREVKCPENGCSCLVPMSTLVDHLRLIHPGITWHPNKQLLLLKLTKERFVLKPCDSFIRTRPIYIIVEDKGFYSTMARDEKNGLWFFWVTMIGQKEEASRWVAEISISNEPDAKLIFKRHVLPYGDPWKEVIEKGEDILVVPDIILKQFRNHDGHLKITLEFK